MVLCVLYILQREIEADDDDDDIDASLLLLEQLPNIKTKTSNTVNTLYGNERLPWRLFCDTHYCICG